MARYIIDTSIWIDLYEDRVGFNGEPLGDYAWRLFAAINERKDNIIVSDILMQELIVRYSVEEINGMTRPFESVLKCVSSNKDQQAEAELFAKSRNLPKGDALHAILARDCSAILVTRDNHFRLLRDISEPYKPEELT